MKNYAIIFALTCVVGFSTIAVFNFTVDPYGLWRSDCIKKFNCRKTEAGSKVYLVKAKHLVNKPYSALIIGNSRTELGIDPEDINSELSYYNLSIRGASIPTTLAYFRNAVDNKAIEHAVLGLDFFSFRERPSMETEWPPAPPTYLPIGALGEIKSGFAFDDLSNMITTLFSLNSSIDSVMTIFNQNREVSSLTTSGFSDGLMFKEMYRSEGIENVFKHDLNTLDTKFRNVNYSIYDRNGLSRSFEALKLIVEIAHREGIKLDIVISPVHVLYLKKLKETGHLNLYLSWKRELVSILKSKSYFENYSLYDFSGVNEYTTEKVPKEKNVSMKYWLEAAHFTPLLGELIINNVNKKSKDFIVTPNNIETRISSELKYFETES